MAIQHDYQLNNLQNQIHHVQMLEEDGTCKLTFNMTLKNKYKGCLRYHFDHFCFEDIHYLAKDGQCDEHDLTFVSAHLKYNGTGFSLEAFCDHRRILLKVKPLRLAKQVGNEMCTHAGALWVTTPYGAWTHAIRLEAFLCIKSL